MSLGNVSTVVEIISPLAIFGHFTARLARRTVSPRTFRSFHRSSFPVISPLGSPVERSHLALPFRSFHRSARPSNGLTSHCHSGHFTARLARRTVSPRTAIPVISPLGSSVGRSRLALPRSTRLTSHCHHVSRPDRRG